MVALPPPPVAAAAPPRRPSGGDARIVATQPPPAQPPQPQSPTSRQQILTPRSARAAPLGGPVSAGLVQGPALVMAVGPPGENGATGAARVLAPRGGAASVASFAPRLQQCLSATFDSATQPAEVNLGLQASFPFIPPIHHSSYLSYVRRCIERSLLAPSAHVLCATHQPADQLKTF